MPKSITKVLIANRGEIALRINRACHELGLSTVAVYSTADADSLHVKFADESVCIGPPQPRESYLNIHALLSAAEVTGADAVHPGYGFLSENAQFARACADMGLLFIGPSADSIQRMGNKIQAKETVAKAGVPLLPSVKLASSDGKPVSESDVKAQAKEMGYPVLIKAANGGGGRGMKIVREESELMKLLEIARSESKAAFGSDEVFIEKYCVEPRHIEFQILGDKQGHLIHLGERDCSIQRRHQKILEETPSPAMTPQLREKMGASAIAAASAVDYATAGTIEFLVDKDKNYYFLEMNTRIQVEHPITEMVTGVDLLREQILTAMGESLKIKQKDVVMKGHSIECRVTAEDPKTFAPSPGRISLFHPPMGYGVRLESTACSDYFVSPYYDSMISKLIVHADTRDLAIAKMREALKEFVILGVKTSIPLHLKILDSQDFREGRYTTKFLETFV
ncbi:MAG: acetyl-CoA carboxylase biotin carboxylase subunit [Deltaproteobacteria bacterium]|nr:acetyl-CoA carboxylase biotin carboxylase subunit [Deltaproteobacteria bacterium]